MTNRARRLLPRQILFATYCLTERSATRAAIRAGYCPRSARNQAYRLLTNDDIRRQIAEGVAAMRSHDAARSADLMDGLKRIFDAALAAGRMDAALGALKTECQVSGVLLRQSRPSPAQRVAQCRLRLDPAAKGS